jgi:hypothetical protein
MYFARFFERIGSARVSQEILSHNQQSIEILFHLDASERAALDLATHEFRLNMTGMLEKEHELTQRFSFDNTTRTLLDQLIQRRDELANKLAINFLNSVRPEIQTLLFTDAERAISIRNRAGIRSSLQAAITYSSYNDWANCAKIAGNSCILNAGTYIVTTELDPANGVHLSGGGASPYSTVLQRPAATTGALIRVASGTSITLSNLTIDGNRYSFPNQNTCTLGQCGPPGGYGCTQANWLEGVDVWVNGSATIDSVEFWNSAGTAALYIAAGTVQSSGFYYGRSTGAWMYGLGAANSYSNTFQYNGTAGLRVSGTFGNAVYGNTFFQNRWEMTDGAGGGQLYIDFNAAWVNASGNTINGNNWQSPPYDGQTTINSCYPQSYTSQAVYGVEIEPGSNNNYILGNEITGNTGAGITANQVGSLHVSGYAYYGQPPNYPMYIHDNNGNNPPFGNYTRGVEVYGGSTGLTLDGVLSTNNYGEAVSVLNGTTGTGWLDGHCLSSRYAAAYTTSYSLTNPIPANTTTCP